jgi:hypothetical protein
MEITNQKPVKLVVIGGVIVPFLINIRLQVGQLQLQKQDEKTNKQKLYYLKRALSFHGPIGSHLLYYLSIAGCRTTFLGKFRIEPNYFCKLQKDFGTDIESK